MNGFILPAVVDFVLRVNFAQRVSMVFYTNSICGYLGLVTRLLKVEDRKSPIIGEWFIYKYSGTTNYRRFCILHFLRSDYIKHGCSTCIQIILVLVKNNFGN